MLKFKNISLIGMIILMIMIVSCEKTIDSPDTNQLVNKNDGNLLFEDIGNIPWDSVDGYLHSTVKTRDTSINLESYKVDGAVYQSRSYPREMIYGGTMTISNKEVVPDTIDGYWYQWASPLGGSEPDYGMETVWSLDGNPSLSVPSFTDTMYTPDIVTLYQPVPGTSISKSSTLNVTWNQDNNNTNDVIVFIQYLGRSNYYDSTLSDQDFYIWKEENDDGSASFSTSELTDLPVGGSIYVGVIRYNSKTIKVNDRNFFLSAVSKAYVEFEVVQ